MAAKSDRLEARVSPEERARIEQAAAFAGEPLSRFMVMAAVARAEQVIAESTTTAVPSDYFDRLVRALDEPSEAPGLAAAARRAGSRRRIRAR